MSYLNWQLRTSKPKVIVLDDFIENLYKRTIIYQQNYMNKIAMQHKALTNSVAAFRFETIVYRHKEERSPESKVMLLNPRLETEMLSFLDVKEVNEENAYSIRAFLVRVLNLCESAEDFFRVLPPCTHHLITIKRAGVISSQAIEDFIDNYQERIDMIKAHYLLNTLKG
jgi:hypothetical protein